MIIASNYLIIKTFQGEIQMKDEGTQIVYCKKAMHSNIASFILLYLQGHDTISDIFYFTHAYCHII